MVCLKAVAAVFHYTDYLAARGPLSSAQSMPGPNFQPDLKTIYSCNDDRGGTGGSAQLNAWNVAH